MIDDDEFLVVPNDLLDFVRVQLSHWLEVVGSSQIETICLMAYCHMRKMSLCFEHEASDFQ